MYRAITIVDFEDKESAQRWAKEELEGVGGGVDFGGLIVGTVVVGDTERSALAQMIEGLLDADFDADLEQVLSDVMKGLQERGDDR